MDKWTPTPLGSSPIVISYTPSPTWFFAHCYQFYSLPLLAFRPLLSVLLFPPIHRGEYILASPFGDRLRKCNVHYHSKRDVPLRISRCDDFPKPPRVAATIAALVPDVAYTIAALQ